MKVLVVLSALVACTVASAPAIAYSGLYSPLNYGINPYIYGGGYLRAAPAYLAAPALRTIAPLAYSAPIAAPIAAPAVFKSQYHSQDELGQATYGHTEPLQTHHAVQDAYGNKVGSYSYLNPHDGQIHRTDYVADALGFRVAANDLPVAPVDTGVAPVDTGVAPLPVQDTPEVAEAKAKHLAELEAARSRSKRSTPASTAPLAVAAPLAYSAPIAYSGALAAPLSYSAPWAGAYSAPLAYSGAIAAPLAYSGAVAAPLAYSAPVAAPAVREATLTTIVNNPGHAVSYRVD